ncbi:uncharacterized protein [Alexandromys fortis]|uniref:uncharacterized protein n=1 Tax=Alexandromys fortis TaxID=100897 RepID=UPI0021525184|nr:uncharacterized protein LOC126511297 [Microtus fortis]
MDLLTRHFGKLEILGCAESGVQVEQWAQGFHAKLLWVGTKCHFVAGLVAGDGGHDHAGRGFEVRGLVSQDDGRGLLDARGALVDGGAHIIHHDVLAPDPRLAACSMKSCCFGLLKHRTPPLQFRTSGPMSDERQMLLQRAWRMLRCYQVIGTEAMKQEVQVETTWFHRWTNFGLENQEACSKSDNQGRPTSPNQGDSTSVLRWCYGGAAQ